MKMGPPPSVSPLGGNGRWREVGAKAGSPLLASGSRRASRLAPRTAAICVNDLYTLDDVPLYESESGRSELRLAVHRRAGQPAVVRAVALQPPPPVAPRTVVELWRRLENRHIAQLYDSFTTPTHAIVCMEAVEGLSLGEVMQAHGLTHEEGRSVFKQVAHGVAAMHRASVCHRSLGLHSIMLQEGAVPRAVIIGLETLAEAKMLSKRCTPLLLCSPEALPPTEPSAGAGSGSARGSVSTAPSTSADDGATASAAYSGTALDIWSLGVLLHALLTGQLPFASEAALRADARSYTPPADLPADARALLSLLLEADPNKRPSAAEVCAHEYVASCPVAADETAGHAELDADVLHQMSSRLGFSMAAITAALGNRMIEESEETSAYRCLLDAKRLFIDRCAEGEHAPPEVAARLEAGSGVQLAAAAEPHASPASACKEPSDARVPLVPAHAEPMATLIQ